MRVRVGPLAIGTHVRIWSGSIGILRLGIGDQDLPVVNPRVSTRRHLGLHAVEVRLRVQATGMHKTPIAGSALSSSVHDSDRVLGCRAASHAHQQ